MPIKKNILLVTDAYPPEIRSASQLMFELARALKERGYEVTVVTSWPQYNLAFDKEVNQIASYMKEENIQVVRVKTLAHHKVNFYLRGMAQLLMPWQFIQALKKLNLLRFDLVLIYSPPLPLGLVGTWFKKKGASVILNIQDLFPDNAIDLGILKNPLFIQFFKKLASFIYHKVDQITVHSEGNKKILIRQYDFIKTKIRVLHNWIDVENFNTQKKHAIIEKFNLENKFIIIFAGVLGPSQYLTFLLTIANNIKDHPDVVILIVGDGSEKELLLTMQKNLALTNVIFHPFIAASEYPQLLKACHLGVVCLSPLNKTPVVPGKLLGFMAAQLPVIAFLNKVSDAHQIILEAQCGFSCFSDDLPKAIALIKKMLADRKNLIKMGMAGYSYVTQYFERSVCVDQIEAIFSQCDVKMGEYG